MSSDIRWSKKPVGLWIGNVFYAEKFADEYLKSLERQEKANQDTFPSDSEKS